MNKSKHLHPAHATTRFYVSIAAFALLCAIVGFWRSYYGPLLVGREQVRAIVELHAAIFVGWILIFGAQGWLAASGRIALHAQLGRIAFAYGSGVVLAGIVVTLYVFTIRVRAGDLQQAHVNLFVGVTDICTFAALLAAAWSYRRHPEIHKRLMVVALTVLLVAPVHRMHWFLGGPPAPVVAVLLIWLAPIHAGILHDIAFRRFIHPAYLVGVAAVVWLKFLRAPLFQSDVWQAFAESIQTLCS